MSYQHEHIPFLEPVDWYNQIAETFATHHAKLTQRDQPAIKKYLPRSLQGIQVLDLGGGDGRRAKLLQWTWIDSRTIVDISQSMLDHAPSRTNKVCADLRMPSPLASASYELILSTFVLLHLDQLTMFLSEARRCMTKEGRMLIVHHHERRPYVHHTKDGPMKIKSRHRRNEEVLSELQATGREVDVFDVDESTKIFCCFAEK